MTESYWQKKRKRAPGGFTSDHPISNSYNIAIIGGGLIGIATAYYLKALGCDRVVVLEKEYIGYGASGRNAGFLLSGLAEPYSRLLVGMGIDSARELMRATIENHDLIAEAVGRSKIDCGYCRSGSYHLATTDIERRELEDSVNLLSRDGFNAEYITDLPKPAGTHLKGFLGAYYTPADGKIDPYAFVLGLTRGLEIIECFEVIHLTRVGGMVEVEGEKGKIRAEMAVLATNGYTPLLEGYFEDLIFPVRGQALASFPLGKNLLGDSPYYANFGYEYFRHDDDNSVIIGGLRNRFFRDEIGYDDEINPALQEALENYIRDRLDIHKFNVAASWSGIMGFTVDGLPLVGTLPHNNAVIAAVGFSGHGFGLGMLVARDLALAIMEGKSSNILTRFSLKRF